MNKELKKMLLVLAIAVLIVGCNKAENAAKTEDVAKTEESATGETMEIKEAKLEDAKGGIISSVLDYSSEKTLVFHDYYGLFVYSLENEQLVKSVNIKDLGFETVQGDDAVFVTYDEEKETLILYKLTDDNAVEINLKDNTAVKIDGSKIKKDAVSIKNGKLIVEGTELSSLAYKPNDSEKVYYPLKDFN